MTESLDERFKRKEQELGDKLREWWTKDVCYSGVDWGSAVLGSRAAMTVGPNLGPLLGLGFIRSDLVQEDTVYLVRKLDMFSTRYEPIEFPWEDMPVKFKVIPDYAVNLKAPRTYMGMLCERDWLVEPRAKWPEPVIPAQPLSWWQWLVIVGFLSWVLCALSRAV